MTMGTNKTGQIQKAVLGAKPTQDCLRGPDERTKETLVL